MWPNETYTKSVYFVIDKTDNDTDLSHFFLQSWTTACASSFQSSACNSDIFRIQKKYNWRTNTMNFVFRLKFLSPSLENTQNTKAHRNQNKYKTIDTTSPQRQIQSPKLAVVGNSWMKTLQGKVQPIFSVKQIV